MTLTRITTTSLKPAIQNLGEDAASEELDLELETLPMPNFLELAFYMHQASTGFSTDETLHLARVGCLRNINDFLIALSASVRRHNADFQCLEIAYNAESKSIGYGLTRRGGRRRQEVFPHVFNDLNFKADYPTYFVWTINHANGWPKTNL